jgi:hypothetical protein
MWPVDTNAAGKILWALTRDEDLDGLSWRRAVAWRGCIGCGRGGQNDATTLGRDRQHGSGGAVPRDPLPPDASSKTWPMRVPDFVVWPSASVANSR